MKHRRAWNRSLFAVMALGLLTLAACSASDGVVAPPQSQTSVLNYDGDQDASPNLPGTITYESAARFTTAQTANLIGGELTEVRFYIQTIPDSCSVKVYAEGTASTPGALLYSADVTAGLTANGWNNHMLTNPVVVPNGDLWVAIEFNDSTTQRTIGCDPGPAAPDGRWLYSSDTGTWAPFVISVNWNIRGVVVTN